MLVYILERTAFASLEAATQDRVNFGDWSPLHSKDARPQAFVADSQRIWVADCYAEDNDGDMVATGDKAYIYECLVIGA